MLNFDMNPHPGAMEAHPGAMETHLGATEARPRGGETCLLMMEAHNSRRGA